MNIDINKLENIKDDLHELKQDEALFIDEDGQSKYAIVPIEDYDRKEGIYAFIKKAEINPNLEVNTVPVEDLSYEEYERIKTMIMEAVEVALKPKAEKLN